MRRAALAAVGGAAVPSAYAAAVRALIHRALRQLRAGDVDAYLRLYSEDVRFVFPGRNSWSGELHGKAQLEPWLRRFVRVGLRFEAHEIVVGGPPWDTTVCIRFTDQAADAAGTVVYANRGVVSLKISWGKVVYQEASEDTEKVTGFDRYLAAVGELSQVGSASPTR